MCDETTEAENEAYLRSLRLSRRELGIGATAAMATAFTGCESKSAQAPVQAAPEPGEAAAGGSPAPAPTGGKHETQSRTVTVETPDGEAEGFFVTPKSGSYPGVLMWPDIAGLRDAYTTMATRLASYGYAVLAVNHYYRSSKLPILENFAEYQTANGKAIVTPMRAALTPDAVTKDGTAFARWLDEQPEVDKSKKLASAGYCMSGSYTFRTAAALPERLGAVASFHGAGLVTTESTSPHTLFSQMKAAALVCIAQNDDQRDPEAKTTLKNAAAAAQLPAEIEVYPAQHGFCCIDAPVYDEAQAEKAWARMLATFERYL